MDHTVKPPQPGRILQALQPAIVKLYRVAGMVALGAILVGLICFLAVTIFYYFNRTWVRPVILGPEHAKVAAATTALADAKKRAADLTEERIEVEAKLKQADRTIDADSKWEAENAPLLPAKPTAESALLRRELEKVQLERAAAEDDKPALEQRKTDLVAQLGEQDKLITRLAASPYIRATEEKRVVGFVPYQNLANAQPGQPLYGCDWGLIKCHNVGKVVSILEGEVQDSHPRDDSVQRGVMVEIELTDPEAAQQNVLFAGSKPFWWL